MGRVRTKTVKKSSKVIIERFYPRLTLDFETNKRICDEIATIASKRLRNKVSREVTPECTYDDCSDMGLTWLRVDRRLYHAFDEAYSARTSSRHLLQTAGRGA